MSYINLTKSGKNNNNIFCDSLECQDVSTNTITLNSALSVGSPSFLLYETGTHTIVPGSDRGDEPLIISGFDGDVDRSYNFFYNYEIDSNDIGFFICLTFNGVEDLEYSGSYIFDNVLTTYEDQDCIKLWVCDNTSNNKGVGNLYIVTDRSFEEETNVMGNSFYNTNGSPSGHLLQIGGSYNNNGGGQANITSLTIDVAGTDHGFVNFGYRLMKYY